MTLLGTITNFSSMSFAKLLLRKMFSVESQKTRKMITLTAINMRLTCGVVKALLMSLIGNKHQSREENEVIKYLILK